MELIVGTEAIPAQPGDDVLTAAIRAGRTPAGCLCFGGDCPNCLAVVDGVAYVRMCQTAARDGMEIQPFPVTQPPPLPDEAPSAAPRRRFADAEIVVIGAGATGIAAAEARRTEGAQVVLLDSGQGDEVLAIYPGPEVVVRTATGDIVRYRAEDVVVATGAAEIQPVVEGSGLTGILTRRAAERLAAAGVDLGRVVAVGRPPEGVACRTAEGELVRFEGADRVEAVVTAGPDGTETARPCDTAVVDLGEYPRDVLARMGGPGVTAAGPAAADGAVPPVPATGTICPCSSVTVADLDSVWERGFQELELLKRATLAGTGTCQGGVCSPYLRSFVADRGSELQPTFTARPLARQMTIGEAAAGVRFPPIHRTGLDTVHRAAGARMDRAGGWWRPWTYGDFEAEYRAVREAVSLGDVSTLGKALVSGPDAVAFLEHVYPCRVGDLAPARSRYALILAESGGLLDDGLISALGDSQYALTFTTGGAGFIEAWLRDWAESLQADVRIMDRTHSLGAINVTGPLATELLARAGLAESVAFMRHRAADLAGVPCHVYRLSFTGEVSYELHHPYSRSRELWTELMRLGADLGIGPHGLDTLMTLRLEKGHVIVGRDTEPDSTPRRLGMDWAVRMDKPDFIGRAALARTETIPLDRRLVGFTMDGPSPVEGSPLFHADGSIGGYITSAAWSPTLGRTVMLGWTSLVDGAAPDEVQVDERPARLSPTPFYDPEGARARA